MKNKLLLTTLLTTALAFNNAAGWKLDDNGAIVLKDGNPVYLDNAGKEMTVAGDTISRLNGEARGHREAKEAAEAKLKQFEGIDPEKATKAIELVSKLDAKTLIDAGEVDKVKSEISSQYQAQIAEKDKALESSNNTINNMRIDNVFANSDFIRENIAVPRDMFEATFRGNFKYEEGKVVAYDKAGNRLMSKNRVGEYAEPDEAMTLLVEMHPQKDTIIKANAGNGSGSGGAGGGTGKGRNIKRADFVTMTPAQQAEISGKVRSGEMSLTD